MPAARSPEWAADRCVLSRSASFVVVFKLNRRSPWYSPAMESIFPLKGPLGLGLERLGAPVMDGLAGGSPPRPCLVGPRPMRPSPWLLAAWTQGSAGRGQRHARI